MFILCLCCSQCITYSINLLNSHNCSLGGDDCHAHVKERKQAQGVGQQPRTAGKRQSWGNPGSLVRAHSIVATSVPLAGWASMSGTHAYPISLKETRERSLVVRTTRLLSLFLKTSRETGLFRGGSPVAGLLASFQALP